MYMSGSRRTVGGPKAEPLDVVHLPADRRAGLQHDGAALAIRSRAEARAYLAHDVLGPRLIECTRLVIAVQQRSITAILGQPDDVKFRSSMTLFQAVSQQPIFAAAIAKFFLNGSEARMLKILRRWVDLSPP